MYLSLRNTRFTEIRSCWFDPSMHSDCLQVWGRDHLIIGYRFVGALNMRVGAGNTEFPPFGGGYSRTEDCLIVGNRMDPTSHHGPHAHRRPNQHDREQHNRRAVHTSCEAHVGECGAERTRPAV
jgi:hypothetical protein